MNADPVLAIDEAVAWIRSGGLVAYPTETLWGLGADATSAAALERLRRWKGRRADAPLSILVDGPEALAGLGIELGDAGRRLAEVFWPGPLTLVLPAAGGFAPGVARADGAVGVRCSSHPRAAALARRLRREAAGPVTATSLNASGEPPARDRREAERCGRRGPDAPRLLDGEAGGAPASSVVDLCGAEPRLLRSGAVGEAELRAVVAGIRAA